MGEADKKGWIVRVAAMVGGVSGALAGWLVFRNVYATTAGAGLGALILGLPARAIVFRAKSDEGHSPSDEDS